MATTLIPIHMVGASSPLSGYPGKTALGGFEDLNREVQSWSSATRKHLVSEQNTSGIEHYSGRLSKVSYGFKKQFGEINMIGFRFMRYGVYVEIGVGRGNKITDPDRNRKPKPWFNPVIDRDVTVLAGLIAEHKAAQIADELYGMIKIKNF